MTHWKMPVYVVGAMASCAAGGVGPNMDSVGWVKLLCLTFAAGAAAAVAYFDKTAGQQAQP